MRGYRKSPEVNEIKVMMLGIRHVRFYHLIKDRGPTERKLAAGDLRKSRRIVWASYRQLVNKIGKIEEKTPWAFFSSRVNLKWA